MERSRNSILRSALSLAVLAALVAIAVWNVDVQMLPRYLRVELLLGVLITLPLSILSLVFGGLRLVALSGEPPMPLNAGVKATALSNGMGLLLPARMAELLKIAYLRESAGIPVSIGMAAVLLERVTDVALLALLIGLSVNLLMTGAGTAFVTLGAAVVLFFVLIRFGGSFLHWLIDRLPLERARIGFRRLLTHVTEKIHTRSFYVAVAYGTGNWLCGLGCVFLFLHVAGSIPVGLDGALNVLVVAMIGGAIPALPGGFGTYEAAVVFVLHRYGYSTEEALLLALTLHVGKLLPSVVYAFVIVLKEHLGVTTLIRDAGAAFRSGSGPADR